LFFFLQIEKEKSIIQETVSKKQNNECIDFSPYCNTHTETYHCTYDVFLKGSIKSCGITFQEGSHPWVQKYYICFLAYNSTELGKKQLGMRNGDVLLAVNDEDVEGRTLEQVQHLLQEHSNDALKLSFLSKERFNNCSHTSVKMNGKDEMWVPYTVFDAY